MRKFRHDVPGPFAITLQIVSGAIAGLLIAGVYLVLKPVKMTDASAAGRPAAEGVSEERNTVVYVRGNPGHPNGQQWRLRERAFLAKDTAGVALSEDDINRWIQTTYGAQDRKIEIKSYDFAMDPSLPTWRVKDSEVEVGIEFSCSIGESKKSIVAQASGHFEKNGNQHVFVPAKVYLGSCPLPGPLGRMLYGKLSTTYPAPENVATVWTGVSAVKVEENRVKLAFN